MKSIVLFLLALSSLVSAQTKIEKSFPLKPGQKAIFQFDYPQAIFQLHDKPEILITGTVSINQGEHDSAFQLDAATTDADVTITSQLKDKENIPHRISIKKGDREYFFKTSNFNDPEVQKFLTENGNEYTYRSSGVMQEIKLIVFVPRNTAVKVESKYGLIEVTAFDGPFTVVSKYGGADISFPSSPKGTINARTQYGEIFTNLDIKFNQSTGGGKEGKRWTEITGNAGNGPLVNIESKYGNIYLRKGK